MVTELNGDNFYDLVERRQPDTIWFVDFFAPWCGPCMEVCLYKKATTKLFLNMLPLILFFFDRRFSAPNMADIADPPLSSKLFYSLVFASSMSRTLILIRLAISVRVFLPVS